MSSPVQNIIVVKVFEQTTGQTTKTGDEKLTIY